MASHKNNDEIHQRSHIGVQDNLVKSEKVLRLLSEQNSNEVTDDTLLEKLREWIIKTFTLIPDGEKEDVLNSSGIKTFLSTQLENWKADVLCMALKLAANLYGLGLSIDNKISHLLSVCEIEMWEDISVKAAWLEALNIMLKHGFEAEEIKEKGYFTRMLSCLENSSLFVVKNAQKLLVTLYITCDGDSHAQHILDHLLGPLKSGSLQGRSIEQFISFMESLFEVDESNAKKLFSEHCIIESLKELLNQQDNVCNRLQKMRVIKIIEKFEAAHYLVYDESHLLEEVCISLHEKGESVPAMHLAGFLLSTDCNDKLEDRDKIVDIAQAPIRQIVPKSSKPFLKRTHDGSVPHQKTYKPSVLLQSIKLSCKVATVCGEEMFQTLHDLLVKVISDDYMVAIDVKRNILREILQSLIDLFKNSCASSQKSMDVYATQVLEQLVIMMQDASIEPGLAKAILKCAATVLGRCEERLTNIQAVANKFLTQLPRFFCGLQWEIRDSAIEFVIWLVKMENAKGIFDLILNHKFHSQVFQCCKDGESYVRGSAFTCLKAIVDNQVIWKDLLNITPLETLISTAETAIKEDTEAFSRRAAMDFLCHWSVINSCPSNLTIYTAIHDLDWQVKLLVLEFCAVQIQQNLPAECQESEVLYAGIVKICDSGCAKTLTLALEDYDQPVRQRACEMFKDLKDRLESLKDCSYRMPNPTEQKSIHIADGSIESSLSLRMGVEEFGKSLSTCDITQMLSDATLSIDEHERNPVSLLDDILVDLCGSTDPDNNEDTNVIIDCY